MASMRDIQRRKVSVQSTGQITKAMKLVSTVKLQKARARVESTKPYFEQMYSAVQSILARSGNVKHKYLKSYEDKKKAVIVITSNRGLAGGYISNIVKLLTKNEEFSKNFKRRQPSKDHWMDFSIGSSACHIGVTQIRKTNSIGVELYINDDKELFKSIYVHKEDVEKIMMDYDKLVMIPNELTYVRQLEQYNIFSSKINIIPTLVHQYCEKVFQKPQK